MLIEFDCDGVLLNTGKATLMSDYGAPMRQNGLDFECTRYFSFDDFPDNVRKSIFASFKDEAVMYNLEWFAEVPNFLKRVSKLIEGTKHKVLLRSAVVDTNLLSKKCVFLTQKLLDLGISNFHVETLMSVDASKHPTNADVLVEDNAKNIINATAEHRMLINHSYNQESVYSDLQMTGYVRIENNKGGWNYLYNYIEQLVHGD